MEGGFRRSYGPTHYLNLRKSHPHPKTNLPPLLEGCPLSKVTSAACLRKDQAMLILPSAAYLTRERFCCYYFYLKKKSKKKFFFGTGLHVPGPARNLCSLSDFQVYSASVSSVLGLKVCTIVSGLRNDHHTICLLLHSGKTPDLIIHCLPFLLLYFEFLSVRFLVCFFPSHHPLTEVLSDSKNDGVCCFPFFCPLT